MLNKIISNILPYMPKKLVWQFSKEYIAGETIDDAIAAAKQLNNEGIFTTIDVLGEFIKTLGEAEANKREYLNVIEACGKSGVQGGYSLKPTSFGLLLDQNVCFRHIREIVAKAAAYDNFIRIDMEDSPCTDMEIALYRKLLSEFPNNVGLVIQAYLKRTLNDLKELKATNGADPLNFRLCKGIYVEPAEIAYRDYAEVNTNYLRDLEYMFTNKMYAGIATHDKNLIDPILKLIERHQVSKDMYEFQMLYGVTPSLRKMLKDQGHRIRVYVPFGQQWFGYSTRRLKENPKMASVIIKAIFVKG